MNTENSNALQTSNSIWLRGLFMLLFAFVVGVVKFVAFTVITVQFLFVLFTNKPNDQLLTFGQSLSTYTYQIMLYLTFNSEQRPFPFAEWPEK